MNLKHCDYITVELDVSQELKLYFLADSRADIRLVKSYKLLGTAEFEPKDRVRIKSVEGSVIETHGSIDSDTGRRNRYFLSFPASKSASGSKRRWDPGT